MTSLPPLPNSCHEQVEQPKPEDVECMCKLLATVGGLLDSSTKTVKNFGGGSKPVATKVGRRGRLGADAWLRRTAAMETDASCVPVPRPLCAHASTHPRGFRCSLPSIHRLPLGRRT